MILHFLADFPTFIKINDINLGTLENSTDTLSVEIAHEQNLLVFVTPISNSIYQPSIPYIAKLSISNNNVCTNTQYIEITDYNCGHFEIKLYPIEIQTYQKPILIENIILNTNLNISIFDNGIYNLEINAKNKIYKYSLNQKIYDYKFSTFIENDTTFIVCEAKTIKKEQFIIVFSDYFCDLEITADYIEYNNQEITALTYQKDIAKHGIVQKYILKENHFILQEEYTVYLDKQPHTPCDEKIIPWAFAEALNIGDLNLARTFLDSSLSNSLEDEHLNTFFGDYDEIKYDKYQNSQDTLCFIYKGNPRKVKTYKFEIINNKIYNIIDLN